MTNNTERKTEDGIVWKYVTEELYPNFLKFYISMDSILWMIIFKIKVISRKVAHTNLNL